VTFSTRAEILNKDRLRLFSLSYYRVHSRESYFAFLNTTIHSLRKCYKTRSLTTDIFVEWENYDIVFLRCLMEASAWIHVIHSFRNISYEGSTYTPFQNSSPQSMIHCFLFQYTVPSWLLTFSSSFSPSFIFFLLSFLQ
jgi:hypothetical protein